VCSLTPLAKPTFVNLVNNIKRIELNMFIFELIVNKFPIKTRCYF